MEKMQELLQLMDWMNAHGYEQTPIEEEECTLKDGDVALPLYEILE